MITGRAEHAGPQLRPPIQARERIRQLPHQLGSDGVHLRGIVERDLENMAVFLDPNPGDVTFVHRALFQTVA